MFKIAQHYLVKIFPIFFAKAINEEGNRLNSHIAKHHLIEPFPNNILEANLLRYKNINPFDIIMLKFLHALSMMPQHCRIGQILEIIHRNIKSPKY